MIPAAAPFPEDRAAGVGNLDGPASAGCDRRGQEPFEFGQVGAGGRQQHGLLVGGHQIDAPVEDRQFGQFAMGDRRS